MIRKETINAYYSSNPLERLMILSYCKDGWDYYWPYTDMPIWLKPRYVCDRVGHLQEPEKDE